jgi:hypothetical protein
MLQGIDQTIKIAHTTHSTNPHLGYSCHDGVSNMLQGINHTVVCDHYGDQVLLLPLVWERLWLAKLQLRLMLILWVWMLWVWLLWV